MRKIRSNRRATQPNTSQELTNSKSWDRTSTDSLESEHHRLVHCLVSSNGYSSTFGRIAFIGGYSLLKGIPVLRMTVPKVNIDSKLRISSFPNSLHLHLLLHRWIDVASYWKEASLPRRWPEENQWQCASVVVLEPIFNNIYLQIIGWKEPSRRSSSSCFPTKTMAREQSPPRYSICATKTLHTFLVSMRLPVT